MSSSDTNNNQGSRSTTKRSWEDHYNQLVAYYSRYGHCHVPYNWSEDPALSWWLSDQRKRQARLSANQRAKLDALSFSWENPKKIKEQQQWREYFHLLKQYHHETNEFSPPSTWSKGGPKLTRWIARQREYYRQGILAPDRKDQLNCLGFPWENTATTVKNNKRKSVPQNVERNNERWQQQYQKLVEYQRQHGNTRVPQKGAEGPVVADKSLGTWIRKQRERYAKNVLPEDRVQLLNAIGFEFSLPDAQFMENYKAAKAFRDSNGGHWKVKSSSTAAAAAEQDDDLNHKRLQEWMYRQRVAYDLGKLDPQRRKLLDDINFPWEIGTRNSCINNNASARTTTIGPAARLSTTGFDSNSEEADNPAPDTTMQHHHHHHLPANNNNTATGGTMTIPMPPFPQQPPDNLNGKKDGASTLHVRKRFHHGWLNGMSSRKKVARSNHQHYVQFSNGHEEYLSDEEFEVAAFAYQNHIRRISSQI